MNNLSSTKQSDVGAKVVASNSSGKSTGRKIQSVERALMMLETLADSDGGIRLNELAREMDLNVSTCHSILNTMVGRGFVGKSARDNTYYLGKKITELNGLRLLRFDLIAIASDALRQLNKATRETIHLAALQGNELVTLSQLDSSHVIRVVSSAGEKSGALHATATGKAILAWLPEKEVFRIISKSGLKKFTDKTITDRDELMEELRLVRRNGVAFDREEFQPGVVCVGAAIRNQVGAIIGAFSCSMPCMRAGEAELKKIEDDVRSASRHIADNLGAQHHADASSESN